MSGPRLRGAAGRCGGFDLDLLPAEIVLRIIENLPSPEDIARFHATNSVYHGGHVGSAPGTLAEEALRRRAFFAGHSVPSQMPGYERSWVQMLCWQERRRRAAQQRLANREPVSAGPFHTAFVAHDGRLHSAGYSYDSNSEPLEELLGHSADVDVVDTPQELACLRGTQMSTVSVGRQQTLAVGRNGRAYWFGVHHQHTPDYDPHEQPHLPVRWVECLLNIPITAVAASGDHALLLGRSGDVYSFGFGFGLGRGVDAAEEGSNNPIQLPRTWGGSACGIAVSNYGSFLVTDAGGLYSCGEGPAAILGFGDCERIETMERVRALAGVRVCSVSCSYETHVLVLADGGYVYSFGQGATGALGHGNVLDEPLPRLIEGLRHVKATAVVASDTHSLVVTEKGKVYSFGMDPGLGLREAAFEEDGSPVVLKQPLPHVISALSHAHIVAVSASDEVSLAVDRDGRVYAWGSMENHNLGLAYDGGKPVSLPRQIEEFLVKV